jgi:enamine deaminase RidA (YjgF/YER057c/UK114 family)
MVFVSGQLGVKPDGTCSEDAYTQATQCLKNVLAVLDGANMGVENVVRLNAYVTHREHLKDYMRARDELLESAEWPNGPPASTLMIVSGFARPEFKVEVEATAAA